jgi:hypothetical protein
MLAAICRCIFNGDKKTAQATEEKEETGDTDDPRI